VPNTLYSCDVKFKCVKCGHHVTMYTSRQKDVNCHQCGQGYRLTAKDKNFMSLVYFVMNTPLTKSVPNDNMLSISWNKETFE
jgi:DNA-directed RNA polymerase subunit RPC12/RpoP